VVETGRAISIRGKKVVFQELKWIGWSFRNWDDQICCGAGDRFFTKVISEIKNGLATDCMNKVMSFARE
jgi:hypothetical protein